MATSPPLTLKFISPTGYEGRTKGKHKQHYVKAIPVKAGLGSGMQVTTDQYITAHGLGGSLGIVMLDGDKAYCRSHFIASNEDQTLNGTLQTALNGLNADNTQALVIGGNDKDQKTQSVLSKIKSFFEQRRIPVSVLAPQVQTDNGCPKGTDLIIKPEKRKVLISNNDLAKSPNSQPLKPLIQHELDLSEFYADVDIPNAHAVKFVDQDKPFAT